MMKKILAAAIVSAFAAPAFAATANVDVYGKLHASVSMFDESVEAFDPDGAGPLRALRGTNDLQFSSNASRIGFKGAEDLGGGLKGIWQIEWGVNQDEHNGTWAGRNSFVGLAGGFGTVLLGNHDTPLKLVGRAVDLFGDTMADSRNVMGGGSDTRAKNVVVYMTPNMGGFGIAAAYSTDLDVARAAVGTAVPPITALAVSGNNGDADNSGVYNVNATYKNGPLFLGLGYGDGDGHEKFGLGAHMRAAAGFDMGAFKLVGQYDKLDDDNSIAGAAAVMPGDYDAWMVGAAYTMGSIVLKANYMEGEYDVVGSNDPEQWTVGVDYNLSKRTTAYALYASGENVTLGGGGGSSDRIGSGVAGGDISAFSVGVTHSF
jgi:predicted porin